MGFLNRLLGRTDDQPLLALDPANELERRLRAVVTGQTGIEPFIEELVRVQIFILVHGKPEPVPPSTMRPLVLPSSQGFPGLCIFTSGDRSLPVQQKHGEFQAGLQVAFTWVLQATPADLGLVVNPGWDIAIELPPQGLARLRQDVDDGKWAGRANVGLGRANTGLRAPCVGVRGDR